MSDLAKAWAMAIILGIIAGALLIYTMGKKAECETKGGIYYKSVFTYECAIPDSN